MYNRLSYYIVQLQFTVPAYDDCYVHVGVYTCMFKKKGKCQGSALKC